jgi:hypothetical protein
MAAPAERPRNRAGDQRADAADTMRRISSQATFFYKRLFPVIWFGLLAAFIVGSLSYVWAGGSEDPRQWLFLVLPIGMAAVGYVIMRKTIFDMVDEVLDAGNALVIRNGGQEDRVALADIMNVGYSMMTNPPRITLSLRRPSRFGETVTFCGPLRFFPFSKSELVEDLIRRIDEARRR